MGREGGDGMSVAAAVCVGAAALNFGWAAYLITSRSPVVMLGYAISIPVGIYCLAIAWLTA